MDWISFLVGVLVGGIVLGSFAFALGISMGALVAGKEDRLSKLVDQLNTGEHIVFSKDRDDQDGGGVHVMDLLLDEDKRLN